MSQWSVSPTPVALIGIFFTHRPRRKPTSEMRAVNPVPVVDTSGSNIDPKSVVHEQGGCSRAKGCQLGLSGAVSDTRQERIVSLLTSFFRFRICQPFAVGPETNVDVGVTSTDVLTHHLSCHQYNVTCHRHQFKMWHYNVSTVRICMLHVHVCILCPSVHLSHSWSVSKPLKLSSNFRNLLAPFETINLTIGHKILCLITV